MKKSFIALVILATVYAPTTSAFVYSGFDVVNHLHQASDTTFIKLAAGMQNPAGCLSDYWYVISRTDPRHDEYLRMAMTALASGKVLTVYLRDDYCEWGMPVIDGLTINRL